MKKFFIMLPLLTSASALAVEPLSPTEMAKATGGTIEPELAQIDILANAVEQAQDGVISDQADLDAVFALNQLLNPLSQFLNDQREVVGVDYGDRQARILDGGVSLRLPVYVERISYLDIQPAVPSANGDMGDVHIEGLRFSDEAEIIVRER